MRRQELELWNRWVVVLHRKIMPHVAHVAMLFFAKVYIPSVASDERLHYFSL